jgi:hypothetical protein
LKQKNERDVKEEEEFRRGDQAPGKLRVFPDEAAGTVLKVRFFWALIGAFALIDENVTFVKWHYRTASLKQSG